jgi:hypothetical protein
LGHGPRLFESEGVSTLMVKVSYFEVKYCADPVLQFWAVTLALPSEAIRLAGTETVN